MVVNTEKYIFVIGKTGVGKSSLCNYVFGTNFQAGCGTMVTTEPEKKEIIVNDEKICIVDTCGIEAGKISDWSVFLNKAFQLSNFSLSPENSIVVYCINAGGLRLENIDLSVIEGFLMAGNKLVIAFTKTDQCSEDEEKILMSKIHSELKKKLFYI